MNALFDPQAYRRDLETTARALRKAFGAPPDFAVVLGSGLGGAFLRDYPRARRVPFADIPHLIPPCIEGHAGALLEVSRGRGAGRRALLVMGRNHYYEGIAPERVVFPVRALAVWGIRRLLLTNAAGSLRPALKVGRLALLRDHLNFTGANPLRGPNLDFLGPRFPSLDGAYRNDFSRQVERAARRARVTLSPAVYVGTEGPSYETEAEIQAYRKLGGDLVGMSTVFEAIAAVQAGVQVAALSAVTNSCLRRREAPNHEEVLENARHGDQALAKILAELLAEKRSGR